MVHKIENAMNDNHVMKYYKKGNMKTWGIILCHITIKQNYVDEFDLFPQNILVLARPP